MSEVVLFFVGLSALTLKLAEIAVQSVTMRRLQAADPDQDELAIEDCSGWLDRLGSLPASLRNSLLGNRLRDALEHVERRGSASALDEELKYLSDLDAARQQEGYSLVRIIIWATPMLGFLGTVVGITAALGDLDPQLLATDPKSAMQGLLAGLYVAFDTTAEALSLSIVLMFIQFFVGTRGIASVVHRGRARGRRGAGSLHRGRRVRTHLAAVQRMANGVLKATEQMVQDQTQHWKHTIDAANSQWKELLEGSGKNLQTCLVRSLGHLAEELFGTAVAGGTADGRTSPGAGSNGRPCCRTMLGCCTPSRRNSFTRARS